MARPKIEFLPLFFTVLAIAFCIALWARIRSYRGEVARTAHSSLERSPNASSPPSIAGFTTGTDSDTTFAPAPAPVREGPARRVEDISRLLDASPLTKPAGMQSSAAPVAARGPQVAARRSTTAPRPTTHDQRPANTSANRPQQTPAQSAQSQSRSTAPETSTTGTSPKDPTSDTQAPQLLAVGFNPVEIHNGEQTVLAVQATDDLSGIRSISGTIAAPSGAVQGFALQREADSDRYSAHITVPKDAAEGIWRVNYLSMIDNASNAATLSASNGTLPPTATFRVVSSNSDSTGPVLKNVWLDKRAIRAGEKATLFVDAQDDNSGVSLVSGVFISPARHARIGFVCRPGSSGPWECEVTTPACIDCGDWSLEQLQLQDKANNMTTIRTDNPIVANVKVNISGDRCDSTPPVVGALQLIPAAVSNVADSVINVNAAVSDDECGVMSMSGQATGPTVGGGSPRLYFSFTAVGAQSWAGRITVPKLAAKGMWRITWIQVLDQAHNLRTYSEGDPVLVNAMFKVQ